MFQCMHRRGITHLGPYYCWFISTSPNKTYGPIPRTETRNSLKGMLIHSIITLWYSARELLHSSESLSIVRAREHLHTSIPSSSPLAEVLPKLTSVVTICVRPPTRSHLAVPSPSSETSLVSKIWLRAKNSLARQYLSQNSNYVTSTSCERMVEIRPSASYLFLPGAHPDPKTNFAGIRTRKREERFNHYGTLKT